MYSDVGVLLELIDFILDKWSVLVVLSRVLVSNTHNDLRMMNWWGLVELIDTTHAVTLV